MTVAVSIIAEAPTVPATVRVPIFAPSLVGERRMVMVQVFTGGPGGGAGTFVPEQLSTTLVNSAPARVTVMLFRATVPLLVAVKVTSPVAPTPTVPKAPG